MTNLMRYIAPVYGVYENDEIPPHLFEPALKFAKLMAEKDGNLYKQHTISRKEKDGVLCTLITVECH